MESLKNKNKLKWVIPISLFVGFLVFFYDMLPYKIVRTMDVSLPYHWWVLTTNMDKLNIGDYIEFIPPVENDYTRGKLLVKKIACGPKDILTTLDRDFYCNGKYLGSALGTDRNGKPTSRFAYNGRVPDDSYFAMGIHPRSYDSRYWGFVQKKNIKHKAFPL